MQAISPARPDRHLGQLLGGTLFGAVLVAAGLGLAFLVVETPLVSGLVPSGLGTGSSPFPIALLVPALALIAGGALLVAGTNRLAITIASVRARTTRGSLVFRAMGTLPDDVAVTVGAISHDRRPTPELVIGPFGVAVVHELGDRAVIRQVDGSWEARTRDGWVATERPLDRAARDADRIRHWVARGDLDFVVRVYAAVVTPDGAMPRSPLCAVITPAQIPAWIASLPRQRTLSASRRAHLLRRVREAVATEDARLGW